ncbi:hypothetical protein MNBD_GAMMA03-983 [hydrothermal vent metagenome]|uniref:SWIM-type domain-containing protein n=1 Tax=hydrothermal vent metagenome TaxID=652676 RepID=A0A3B0W3I5_9ZZZZ
MWSLLHDPLTGHGHCSCPDFNTNKLNSCKHLIHLYSYLKKKKNFSKQIQKEKFPFVHIHWDSAIERPRYFYDRKLPKAADEALSSYFETNRVFCGQDIEGFYPLLERLRN